MGQTTDVSDRHADVVAKIERIMADEHADPPPQVEPPAPAGRAFC